MAELVAVEGIAVPVTRSQEYRSVYVNHATAGHTNWELHFTLGTLVEVSPGKIAVQEEVMLMMTYEFAKAMLNSIGQVVKAYETKEALQEPESKAAQAKPA